MNVVQACGRPRRRAGDQRGRDRRERQRRPAKPDGPKHGGKNSRPSCVPLVRVAPLLALLAFVAELSLRPMAESDLFFRIKAGQEILARHGLPGRNLFSFTYPDHPDVDAAWLFEVGGGGAPRARRFPGGRDREDGGAAGGVRGWRSRSAGGAARGRSPARWRSAPRRSSAANGSSSARTSSRSLGVVGAAVRDRRAGRGRRGKRARARGALVLCAGVALWANLHAGAFVAPVVLACAAGGRPAGPRSRRRRRAASGWRRWRGGRASSPRRSASACSATCACT